MGCRVPLQVCLWGSHGLLFSCKTRQVSVQPQQEIDWKGFCQPPIVCLPVPGFPFPFFPPCPLPDQLFVTLVPKGTSRIEHSLRRFRFISKHGLAVSVQEPAIQVLLCQRGD